MTAPRRAFLALALMPLLAACPQETPVTDNSPPITAGPEAAIVLRTTFALNSYALNAEAQREMDALAIAMNTNPQLLQAQYFAINGHTDITGRLGYNMGLSAHRAGAVMDALIARGVAAQRLRAQGFGPLQLLDPVNPRSGVNRRVEVVAYY